MLKFARPHDKDAGRSREILQYRGVYIVLEFPRPHVKARVGAEKLCTRSAEACFTFGNNTQKNTHFVLVQVTITLLSNLYRGFNFLTRHHGEQQDGVIARYLPRVPISKWIFESWVSKTKHVSGGSPEHARCSRKYTASYTSISGQAKNEVTWHRNELYMFQM